MEQANGLWVAVAVAVLIVGLRCAPAFLGDRLAGLPAQWLSTAVRIGVFLALVHASYGLAQLRGQPLAGAIAFAGTGLAVYLWRGRLSWALVAGAAAAWLAGGLLR
jgi:hypothetical protein